MAKNAIKRVIRKIARSNKLTRYLVRKMRSKSIKKEYEKLLAKRMNSLKKVDYLFDPSIRPEGNVIIISIDCLRYRNLSFTGYFRETTPFMDSLKAKFRAISAAPWTYPSVSSLMSGLYPHVHNADFKTEVRYFNKDNFKNLKPMRNSIVTLPEILYILGYKVYFSSTIEVVNQAFRGRVMPRFYYEKPPAEKVLKDYKKILMNTKKPFFAYIHLGDLHIPLRVPRKFKNFFGKVKKLPNVETWDFVNFKEQKGPEFREYKQNRILLYDNALRYVDTMIEDFYNALERKGILDDTLFIITSDHGEGFWEHSKEEYEHFYSPRGYHGIDHGHNLYQEIIEIPVILDGGLVNQTGNFKDNFVSSVDIAPTILDILSIDNRLPLNGMNIFESYRVKNKPILSEAIAYGYEKKALIIGNLKLLYAPKDGVKWVYHLDKDIYEKEPKTDENTINRLSKELHRFLIKTRISMLKKVKIKS